jgi:hypothetical protein
MLATGEPFKNATETEHLPGIKVLIRCHKTASSWRARQRASHTGS